MERREHTIRHANVILGVAKGSMWLTALMGIASLSSGCIANAKGIRAEAGLHFVDESENSSSSKTSAWSGWNCWFKRCETNEVRGS